VAANAASSWHYAQQNSTPRKSAEAPASRNRPSCNGLKIRKICDRRKRLT
jgi:hypothetical protein